MASFINKAKAKVEELAERNQNKGDNPHSSNAGPHSSNLVNKADPSIDSDRDHRNDPTSRVGGYGNTQTADQYGMAQGSVGVSTSDTYGSAASHPGYDNPRSSNAGPHSSNLMNKADPRVDSDFDHRNDPTSRVGGVGNTQRYGDNYSQASGPGGMANSDTGYSAYAGHTGPTGYTSQAGHTDHVGHTGGLSGAAAAAGTGVGGAGSSYGTGVGSTYDNQQSTNAGPHSSNLMNKLDPRHDSDRDHRNDPTSRVGGYGTQGGDYGHTTGTGMAGAGEPYAAGNTSTYDNPQSTNAGPHSSNLMNKLDPRHDSDRDHRNDPTSRVGGYGTQGDNYGHNTGVHGGTLGHTPAHQATTDSAGAGYGTGMGESYGTSHTGTHGVGHTTGGYGDTSYTPGSGNASNTAGPHNSNLMNKLDPRVDSDLDGSKTYGGNKTHY